MNTLPELVLSTIFNYLRDSERILTLALVCKKWYNIVHSGASWKKVDFDYQRNVTPDILDKYVYAGTRKILLSEFCFLKWTDICGVLRRCKTIEVLIVPWIGYKKVVGSGGGLGYGDRRLLFLFFFGGVVWVMKISASSSVSSLTFSTCLRFLVAEGPFRGLLFFLAVFIDVTFSCEQ